MQALLLSVTWGLGNRAQWRERLRSVAPHLDAPKSPLSCACRIDDYCLDLSLGTRHAMPHCVIRLLASGLTDGEIAAALRIGVRTVREHVARAIETLRARSRAQAVAIACLKRTQRSGHR